MRYNVAPMRVLTPVGLPTFPDPRDAGPEGVVAVGSDLRTERLRAAYRRGIFPWPHDGLPLLWFCPWERAILEFSRLHIGASLAKARRKSDLQFTLDQNFDAVIDGCRRVKRPGQRGTWITPVMQSAYRKLHREGDAHSVEAWSRDGLLVGGIYGVDADGVFCGESMFHLIPNASKLALLFLADHLQARGARFMDIQQMTPHMERMGAREIGQGEFLERLAQEQARSLTLFPKSTPL